MNNYVVTVEGLRETPYYDLPHCLRAFEHDRLIFGYFRTGLKIKGVTIKGTTNDGEIYAAVEALRLGGEVWLEETHKWTSREEHDHFLGGCFDTDDAKEDYKIYAEEVLKNVYSDIYKTDPLCDTGHEDMAIVYDFDVMNICRDAGLVCFEFSKYDDDGESISYWKVLNNNDYDLKDLNDRWNASRGFSSSPETCEENFDGKNVSASWNIEDNTVSFHFNKWYTVPYTMEWGRFRNLVIDIELNVGDYEIRDKDVEGGILYHKTKSCGIDIGGKHHTGWELLDQWTNQWWDEYEDDKPHTEEPKPIKLDNVLDDDLREVLFSFPNEDLLNPLDEGTLYFKDGKWMKEDEYKVSCEADAKAFVEAHKEELKDNFTRLAVIGYLSGI